MRERLEKMSLSDLRVLARENGVKSLTNYKKSELIDKLMEIYEESQVKERQRAEAVKTSSSQVKSARAPQPKSNGNVNAENSSERAESAVDKSESKVSYSKVYTNNSNQQVASSSKEYKTQKYQSYNNSRYIKNTSEENNNSNDVSEETAKAEGLLEITSEGYGFIRSANFLPGDDDVYVSSFQIRQFRLKTGDMLLGRRKVANYSGNFAPLILLEKVNNIPVDSDAFKRRRNFEDLTPIFPNKRISLSKPGSNTAMRIIDLFSPIGKGQRGMIVSQPKAGKTTLLKQVAQAVLENDRDMHLIILLIDERPEEVTDIKETIYGKNVEIIYSTFDELPDRHKRVSEMVIERAKRLVEGGWDVTILLDSITRLTRAYNLTISPSGRTLSGGLDPAALYMPKRFFGAARNMREGGSLTILATALVDTGSKMDDVVFEEFKGTGNMELVLDRKLSEKRMFPAIDIQKTGTRNEKLLLKPEEQEAMDMIHKALSGLKAEEATEKILDLFAKTKDNTEFIELLKKQRLL